MRSEQPLLLINVVGLTPSLLGEATPQINALLKTAKLASLQPVFPAVTSTVQASILTGAPPSQHGIVGNGWYVRDQAEVRFWLQPNALIQGEKVWHTLKREMPGFRCSQLFWWYNMYADVDASITPRPHYPADGRKQFGLYSSPPGLHEQIEAQIGEFPFHGFWGPAAGIASSRWIVECAMAEFQISRPHLQLIYLPHLDYSLQRVGPEHPSIAEEVRAIDHEVGRLLAFAEAQGAAVMLLSEYGIEAVAQSVSINRVLRAEGLLQVRQSLSWELLDPGASAAFAVADHQVAHVYVKHVQDIPRVKALLQCQPGIEQVLDKAEQRAWQLDHARSGELVAVAAAGFWFDYYYWLDERKAPDFARTVDIHRKPGYDPVELFIDPAIRLPKLKVARRLLQKKLGFRYYMDLIPLDTGLVRGSHGRLPTSTQTGPLLITNCDLALPQQLAATAVKQLLLEHFLGRPHLELANAKELSCGEPYR
ncbi:alkaline phosphatase family protein [Pseudomonas salomonii]|uniref:Predicted pyrophosphatase or phosphodiesterase, AlkP superfamily n=1 Tax=Pseudomonas salomonii TaxID=191391 RepID=A0A1H3PNV0_9PSED|nr:nucleotide pyrophosphatase/phosphodiesterase family protein [Pseudomonas salomonii]SDZ02640.1 Predicted pyrophosphatase or phosphodiesterase, AlkP superfamily [Pseudomonas salomonii]